MAPVATNETPTAENGVTKGPVKAVNGNAPTKLFNPFYSPTVAEEANDEHYQYANYKVRFSQTMLCYDGVPVPQRQE